MVPLAMGAIAVAGLAIERAWFWGYGLRGQTAIVREGLTRYARQPEAAIAYWQPYSRLPMVRIFQAAITLDGATPDEFRLALESTAQAELPGLKRFSTLLETIANVAPLLGLLGTILGLINAFGALRIGEMDPSQATGVTGGISEALVSTAAGLVVAIAALLCANTCRSLYRRQIAQIAACGGQLELLHRQRYERAIAPPHHERS